MMGGAGIYRGRIPVVIDLRALQPGYKAHFGRGIGRVVHELALRLPDAAGDLNLVGLVQAGLEEPDSIYLGNSPRLTINLPWPRSRVLDRLLGQELILPLSVGRQKALTHYMAHLDAPAFGGGAAVVTVHDLILARKAGELAKGGWARRILRGLEARAARRAGTVVTVSAVTAEEVSNYLGVRPDKIKIIPSAAGDQFRPLRDPSRLDEAAAKFSLQPGFVLTVGGFDPRKNLPRLVRAWKRVDANSRMGLKLVFVGGMEDREQVSPVLEEIKKEGLEDSVRLLGRVDDQDLPVLYNLAGALVFPSFYEGFGLPALEAMSCGCPVLAARAAALPEVVGEAGLYFDPSDTSGIAEAMKAVVTNTELRDELRAKGLKQATRFTWEKAARGLAGIYREAVEVLG